MKWNNNKLSIFNWKVTNQSIVAYTVLVAALLLSPCLCGQDGPGGIGTSDGAGSTPVNTIWLEAESLGQSDGDDITSWPDISGNANDFSILSTYSPIFRNAVPLNGRAYAEFSKANNRIVLNPFSDMPGSTITTMIVYKTSDSGDGLFSYATTSQNNEYLLFDNSSIRTYIENSNHNSGVALNGGSWQIFTNRWRSSDGDLKYFQNSTQQSSTTLKTGATITAGGSLAIGGEQDAVDGGYDPGQAFAGDIAEIIVYDAYLNDAQRRIVENYLSAKYDISIGANDLYAGDNLRNYEYGVIGIGQEANGSQLSNSNSGIILSPYNGSLDTDGEYIFAGHDNKTNAVATDSLGVSIEERWFKSWYIDKTTAGTLDGTIAFDFGDGIGGQYPANNTDYELLRLDLGGTDNYEVVTVASKSVNGDQISFEVTDANLADGFYTLGTTDATNAPVDGISNSSWYSYKTGDWTDPLTWTTDPSGNLRIPAGGGVPTDIDNVEILVGRTVTTDIDNITAADLIVNGNLVINTTSGHAFSTISGDGKISISGATDDSDNFPDGDASGFADALNGGMLEIIGDGIDLDQDREFNNVFINLDASTDVTLLLSDWTIHGTLDINQGIFQINDATAGQNLTINAYGDVSVQGNAGINVGAGNARHEFNFHGNFINSGTVEFTNRSSADYSNEATDGIVDANFISGDADQTIDCLGPTTFYRIEIDKGDDQTYILDISAASTTDFNIYGPADYGHGSTSQLTSNDNSLGLLRGTVRLNSNVDIPVLNNTGNYNISMAARLWINGGSATKPSGTAIVPYGTVQVSDGTLTAPVSSGITTRDNGNIVVEGGILTTRQIRTSVLGAQNIGGYTQSGGEVNLTGGSINRDYYTFSLTYTGNTFNMSGGTLNISGSAAFQDNSGTSGQIHGGALFINSAEGNYNVTGGTVIIDNTTGVEPRITSTAPLWNLTLTNSGGSATEFNLDEGTSGDDQPGEYETILNPTLRILNNFIIENDLFDHNGYNVEIGSDFIIQNGADYIFDMNGADKRLNTTTMNGVDNSLMAFYNRTGGSGDEQRFWNLVVDKPSGKTVTLLSGKTNVNSNNNNLLRVDGNHLKVLSGTLDQGVHSIRIYTDTLLNYDVLSIYNPVDAGTDPNPNSNNDLVKFRPDPFVLITADTSQFGNVRLNNGSNITTLISDVYIQRMQYRHGRIDMQDNNLKIDELFIDLNNSQTDWNGCGGCNSVEDMFIANGNASAGGLSLYVDANQTLTFPIGVGTDGLDADVDGGLSKYTPVTVTVSSVIDSGYMTIRPVDATLPTTEPSGGDILSYYWRVSYEGFPTLPTVSYQYTYYTADLDGSVNEASFVPGKVLDSDPFTRSSEMAANLDDLNNLITFDNDGGGGFTLERANYTAGQSGRFVGAPTVYYSRADGNWNSSGIWSTVSHTSTTNTGTYPQSGDVAIIGYNGSNFHRINAVGNVNVAILEFNSLSWATAKNISLSRVLFGTTENLFAGIVRGVGELQWASSNGTGPGLISPTTDLGEFISDSRSSFIYTLGGTGDITIPALEKYPSLRFYAAGANGSATKTERFFMDRAVECASLLLDGNSVLEVTHDILVTDTLFIGANRDGELIFNNGATATTVETGNLVFGSDLFTTQRQENVNKILVESGGGNGVEHRLIVNNDISIATGSGGVYPDAGADFDLYTNASDNNVVLELTGSGNHAFTIEGDDDIGSNGIQFIPEFYRIEVNKGTSKASSFEFADGFTLEGTTSGATKALELQNGLLVLNTDDDDIDIDLTTGGGDFVISSSTGLQVSSAIVHVGGDDTGIRLDGCLIIDGGTVDMDDAGNNGNNYIEYGAGGEAILEISSGTLTVGSQIRPITSAETGILQYRQTGGDVVIGKNDGGENDRGMLQIYNTGSEFTYTAGTLVFVQHQGTPSIAALYLDPDTYDVSGSTITIFNGDTPTGQSDFRINSTIPLNNLQINDTNSPTVHLNINTLEIEGTLTIAANATLDANGLDLILDGDVVNDGTYIPNGNTTIFSTETTQDLSGTGTFDFFDLTKNGTGTLNLGSEITIANTFFLEEGSINDGGNSIFAAGNVVIDGTHSSSGGNGIVFSGASSQQLSRSASGTGTLGTITINNTNGIEIPDGNGYNFDITGDLRLESGVFNIGGALVSVASSGDIVEVNAFGLTNMVQTNSSFTDNGLKKSFPAGHGTDFTFPIGQLKYTPVAFDFSSGSNTFGSTAGSITVRPANEYHPTIDDGSDYFATGDVNNVLQYHWIINADNVTGFTSDVEFYYDQADVKSDEPGYTEADYIPAQILSDNNPTNVINKFDVADVDDGNNIINFTLTSVTDEGISGDYFAGIDEAIPDNVPIYTTVVSGDVDAAIYDIPVPGGGAPRGAEVVVSTGTTVTFNINNVNLYKTQIQSGAILEVDETDGHRLGTVSGTGTLRLSSSTNSVVVPAGYYTDFFSCTGGGLEYTGTGSYDILGGIPNIRNLTLSGSGDRNFPNLDVTICEDLVVDGPTLNLQNDRSIYINGNTSLNSGILNAPTGNNSRVQIYGTFAINGGTYNGSSTGITNAVGSLIINSGILNVGNSSYILQVWGDLTYNGGFFLGGSGNAKVSLRATASFNQSSIISGNFAGFNSFHNLEIDKRISGLVGSLNNSIEVSNQLILISGVINTNGNSIILGSSASVSPSIGKETSYINGRVVKTIASAGDDFVFPIGSANRWRPAYVQNVSAGGLDWEAEYFVGPATNDPLVTNLTPADASIETMSLVEYWKISDGNAGTSGVTATVGLSWGDESYVSSVSNEREQLEVMAWNGATWDNYGGANFSSGHSQSHGSLNSSSALSFSEKIITLGSTDLSNPLPVELVSFTGREENGLVKLSWVTASELNNDYFLVEHSMDGLHFREIGDVQGHGTTQDKQVYSFLHRQPVYPKNYYRLKQVDFDGAFEYSDVILVNINQVLEENALDFTMYPNPTSGKAVNIQLNNADFALPLAIEVVNLNGRRVYARRLSSIDLYNDITLDLGYGAARGIYIIKLTQENSASVKRLVLK